jgi:hypothetical protein
VGSRKIETVPTRRFVLVSVAAVTAFTWAIALSAASPATAVKLTVTVTGKGTVTSSPKGMSCPKACAKTFAKGKTVKLMTKPASGWAFTRWTGACAKAKQTCAVKLTADKKAGAVFNAKPQPPPPPPAGFTPSSLSGSWNGTWRNETFGSTGPASIVMSIVNATSFTFTANFGGNVFGCSSPPPASGTVTQGTGPNTWNADGFNVDITTPIGGKVVLAYVFAASSMTGSGVSGCNPSITWKMTTGTFAGNTFTGRIEISLSGAPLATSVLTLTRDG